MLSLVDCIAFSGLTDDQLDAIADYQHLPPVLAAEWAETMLDSPAGRDIVETMLRREVAIAADHGKADCVRRYRQGLVEFVRVYPPGSC